jgi:CRP-like cAMP-binding protein
MAASQNAAHNLMIRKLESIFRLSAEERHALQTLPVQLVDVPVDQDIVRIGDRPTQACLLVAGYIFGYKLTDQGKRQIVGVHVPGDIPDLQSLHLDVLDLSIATFSPCTVGFIQHTDLRRVCDRHPRIAAALWRETLVDASISREWLLNVGRRDAYPRMAHLLCEFMARLKAVGLATDSSFDLPITQVELADAVGTSTVHANRVLQSLRADGLIRTRGSQVIVPDWEKLKAAGQFDPLYLHLVDDEATRP